MSSWVEVYSNEHEGRTISIEKYTQSNNDYKVRTTIANDEDGIVESVDSLVTVMAPRAKGEAVSSDYEGLKSVESGIVNDFNFSSQTASYIVNFLTP